MKMKSTQTLLYYPNILVTLQTSTMSLSHKIVLVIGGTGAQGMPVIKCKGPEKVWTDVYVHTSEKF